MTKRAKFVRTIIANAALLMLTAAFAFQLSPAKSAQAAVTSTLFLSPSSGTFVVDSTFDVSVFLNTQGNTVNTIDLAIKYPPDKLQLVSSGTGKSIIGLWTSQPKYNNQTGTLELTGGIPGGVKVDKGLITTLTFRVKAVGSAVVKFDRTRVLLNDGLGTEVLTQNQNSLYELILPPPAGPVVVSETHPDQTQWYRSNTVILKWLLEEGADGFSYIISDQPIDVPDEISEGVQRDVVYRNLADGRKYFHIRALRAGSWGGTTHFALNIDTSPPAEFKPEVTPSARTDRTQPVIQFATTDSLSGTDHYELKLVSLKLSKANVSSDDAIFIEAQSPYIPTELSLGNYDIIIRAYDKAGNYREATQRIEIVSGYLKFVSKRGLVFAGYTFPWWILLLIMLIIIIALWILGRRMHLWHRQVHSQLNTGELPSELESQMDELQKYRARYGKMAVILLAAFMSLSLFSGAQAQTREATKAEVLDSPLITTVSQNITNDEIFYIGGKTGRANAEVVLYMQNLQTAETISETLSSDKNGEWFYRHNTFLNAGNYVFWAQTKSGNELSPPSPQVRVSVEETAVQFGATRISYATMYLILFVAALIILISLVIYIIYHGVRGRKKHAIMLTQLSEAQESLRRGFAVLNRDIQAELETIHKVKLNQKLSQEEREREEQLLRDLDDIQQHVSKEIWDIENAEHVR